MLSKPFTLSDVSFIIIGQEIRKLQWFEYFQNGHHGCCDILGFVTSYSPNEKYKKLLIMGLQEYFATVLNMCLFIETGNNFSQSNPNL